VEQSEKVGIYSISVIALAGHGSMQYAHPSQFASTTKEIAGDFTRFFLEIIPATRDAAPSPSTMASRTLISLHAEPHLNTPSVLKSSGFIIPSIPIKKFFSSLCSNKSFSKLPSSDS